MEQATRALLQEYCENYWDFGLGLSSDYLEFSDEKFDILLNVASNHDQAIKKCTQEQLARFPLEIDFEVIVAHVVLQLSDDRIIDFKRLALALWDPHKKDCPFNDLENCQNLAFNFIGKYAEYEYLGSLVAQNLADSNSIITSNMLKANSISIKDLLKDI
ncbi:hypothetical protein [Synechococcus sp. Cruz CV12-2-Slac-r]|uniref:hypothetical protein n=1 Tax=Synechococcus sp. Cruz CV12-2-Slac-r TaxID=2823748 RepID=UPI0020CBDB10|nr:hypothetical protein [Synechococcus sp. Cruz CV12-2-Slac-r]MCP9939870.1 hypothetical protein [Synechococcus sp. Cruz CV12-2-Slac-r]